MYLSLSLCSLIIFFLPFSCLLPPLPLSLSLSFPLILYTLPPVVIILPNTSPSQFYLPFLCLSLPLIEFHCCSELNAAPPQKYSKNKNNIGRGFFFQCSHLNCTLTKKEWIVQSREQRADFMCMCVYVYMCICACVLILYQLIQWFHGHHLRF